MTLALHLFIPWEMIIEFRPGIAAWHWLSYVQPQNRSRLERGGAGGHPRCEHLPSCQLSFFIEISRDATSASTWRLKIKRGAFRDRPRVRKQMLWVRDACHSWNSKLNSVELHSAYQHVAYNTLVKARS